LRCSELADYAAAKHILAYHMIYHQHTYRWEG